MKVNVKKQTQIQFNSEIKKAMKVKAAALGLTMKAYLEKLIIDDCGLLIEQKQAA